MKLFDRTEKNMDMTTGAPLKQIILFGLPILIGNIFQQLYNMVDSIVVGNFVGANALAAVGASGNILWLLIALASGLTTGASIVVSQLVGAKRHDRVKSCISTTLTFTVALSVLLSVIGFFAVRPMCRLTRVPDDIIEDSVTYLKIIMAGIIFMMLYNFFASLLRALGDSTTPLIFLIIASVLNILGDLWFVIGLKMGVAGVAWATVGAQVLSVILCAVYTRARVEYFKFNKGEFTFDRQLFKEILRMGLPGALQESVVCFGFLMVQGLINSFGSTYIASYTAASKMEQLSHLPVESFSTGFAVFVGQNMGAGNIERTKEGQKKTFLFTGAFCIVLAVLLIGIGRQLVGLFVDGSETTVIEYGAKFLRIFAPFTVVFAGMNVLNSTLRGSGDSVAAMIAMMTDLAGRVIAAYILCSFPSIGFLGIAYAIPIGWTCSAIVGFIRFKTGKWKNKTVRLES